MINSATRGLLSHPKDPYMRILAIGGLRPPGPPKYVNPWPFGLCLVASGWNLPGPPNSIQKNIWASCGGLGYCFTHFWDPGRKAGLQVPDASVAVSIKLGVLFVGVLKRRALHTVLGSMLEPLICGNSHAAPTTNMPEAVRTLQKPSKEEA